MGDAPVRRALSRLRGWYRDWLTVRWLVNLTGGAAGVVAAVRGVLEALAVRARSAMGLDSPEYVSEITWRTIWDGWRLPTVDWRLAAAAFAVAVVVAVVATLPCPKPDNGFDRDPQRLFDAADRAWLEELCAGRCEHRTLGAFRCRAAFEQMDHHYPWSHGGATDRHNLVGLCRKHNQRKSDRIPTLLGTWCLYRARLGYMPAHMRAWAWPTGKGDGGTAGEPDGGAV